jgi:hypothetical protein
MIIKRINNTTINAKFEPYPPVIYNSSLFYKTIGREYPAYQSLNYIQEAPTIIKRINNTTINAKPAPYPWLMKTPPLSIS